MNDREQLLALIGEIYDAALDPAQRSDVLDKIANFTGGHSGGLLSKHSLSKSGSLYCCIGADPETLRAYSESYPKLAELPSSCVEQVVSTADLVPYEEFRRGRFYREWARPHGWVDVASAVIERSAASCTFLSVVRHEASGLVDNRASDFMGSTWTCASWMRPHFVHRRVQCSKPERDAIARWTAMSAWHLGQRGSWAARGGNSGGDDCRSDMALIRARSRLAII
jgi:hypothetical protein